MGGRIPVLPTLAPLFRLLGPFLTLIYPLYCSFEALENVQSTGNEEVRQWLTYWIIYSLLTLFEAVAARVLVWFPFYSTLKMAFVAWLVLPSFHGASYIYETAVRPYAKQLSAKVKQQMGNKDLQAAVNQKVDQVQGSANAQMDQASQQGPSWLPGTIKTHGN